MWLLRSCQGRAAENLGCPADDLSGLRFTLVDFSRETLDYTRARIDESLQRHGRTLEEFSAYESAKGMPLVPTLLRLAVPNMLAMLATALAATPAGRRDSKLTTTKLTNPIARL